MNFTQLLLDATTVAENTGCAVVALSEPVFSGARHMILLAPPGWDKAANIGAESWYQEEYPDELSALWDEVSKTTFFEAIDEFVEEVNDQSYGKATYPNVVRTDRYFCKALMDENVPWMINNLMIDRPFIENVLRMAKTMTPADLPKIREARDEINREIESGKRRTAADVAVALGLTEEEMWSKIQNGSIIVKNKIKHS
jgi:hypothetical protein